MIVVDTKDNKRIKLNKRIIIIWLYPCLQHTSYKAASPLKSITKCNQKIRSKSQRS